MMRRPGMGPSGVVACWLTVVVVMAAGCMPVGPGRMVMPPVTVADAPARPVPAPTRAPDVYPERAERVFGSVPLLFVENRGQTDPRVSYYVHGVGASVFFGPQAVTHVLRGPADEAPPLDQDGMAPVMRSASRLTERQPLRQWAIEVELVGASTGVQPRGERPAPTVVSYFKGLESDWRAGLPTYTGIVYPDAWPGIDLVYEGAGGRLKSSYVVRPGADPRQIVLAYRGAASVGLGEGGDLAVETPVGGFREEAPVAFQDRGGERVMVGAGYRVEAAPDLGASLVTFDLAPYDPGLPLVIDPVVVYKTSLGGPGVDAATSIKVDSAGHAYVAGYTEGLPAGVPVAGPDLGHNGNWDVFVGKLNPAGTAFVYLGYIGSNGTEDGSAIAIDAANRAYVVGATNTGPAGPGTPNGFPVKVGPSLIKRSSWDGFVARVSAGGTTLEYAGYIGGNGVDSVNGVAADATGNAYLVGTTTSTKASGFPWKVGPGTDNAGGDDGFLAKVHNDGTEFIYAGFIGTAVADGLRDVVVDGFGSAYAIGDTRGHVPGRTDLDVMLVKLTTNGDVLEYWGGWGGARDDLGKGIAIDADGVTYVVGQTNSTDYPSAPDFPLRGDFDGFISKMDTRTNRILYSRYLGGDASDGASGVAVDSVGSAYVVGFTQSTPAQGFPVLGGPDLTYAGLVDGFLVKVRPTGDGLDFGTYFEGDTGHAGTVLGAVAVDQQGNAYVAGMGVDSFVASTRAVGQQSVVGKVGEPLTAPPPAASPTTDPTLVVPPPPPLAPTPPTSTPEPPPPDGPCAPRPSVRITTTRNATGQILVTVTATTNTGTPANTLREIRIGAAKNAVVDFPQGPNGIAGNYTHALTARPAQTTFAVRRTAAGPLLVPLEVVDDCPSVWKTFVGAGASVR